MCVDTTLTPLAAAAVRVTVPSELYCIACGTVLMDKPAGDLSFRSKVCDCSWGCCEHSRTNHNVRGYSCHAAHLQTRPKV
jgi:hypothetical protein